LLATLVSTDRRARLRTRELRWDRSDECRGRRCPPAREPQRRGTRRMPTLSRLIVRAGSHWPLVCWVRRPLRRSAVPPPAAVQD